MVLGCHAIGKTACGKGIMDNIECIYVAGMGDGAMNDSEARAWRNTSSEHNGRGMGVVDFLRRLWCKETPAGNQTLACVRWDRRKRGEHLG